MPACSNCDRQTPVLVIVDSEWGEFGLCRLCYVEPPVVKKRVKTKKRGNTIAFSFEVDDE